MKTGAELISWERYEQVLKHGWTPDHDDQYTNFQLLKGAQTALTSCADEWPEDWDVKFRDKILQKSRKEQLIIAGAFIAAEIDRLQREEEGL